MCRWFAYISVAEPCLLADVLITPANAIGKQCSEHYLPQLLPHGSEHDLGQSKDKLMRMRNSLLNMDGLGVSWYTDSASKYVETVDSVRPALYKSQSPPFNDFNFRSLCDNTETKCLFAHIRASSGGVVSQANCHPFVFGRHTFMHNGVVSSFTQIRRDLTGLLNYDTYCNIIGSTDSEHLAALYMTNLTNNGTKDSWAVQYPAEAMKNALIKTITQLMELQKDKLGAKASPNSLNLCVTDGQKLVAIRFRNHESEQPPSLYWSQFAGAVLNQKYPGHPDMPVSRQVAIDSLEQHGKHTIVASEPTTCEVDLWHLIKRNSALVVDEAGLETETLIEYDPALNAVDPGFP